MSRKYPFQWRVTKYDPAFRNEAGHFTVETWTFFAQVGKIVNGVELTLEEYIRTENAYVAAAMIFISESGIQSVRVADIQQPPLHTDIQEQIKDIPLDPMSIKIGALVTGLDLENLIRLILRDVLWCRLKGDHFNIHFGWDYYMYISSRSPCSPAIDFAHANGLFVEEYVSPYHGSQE